MLHVAAVPNYAMMDFSAPPPPVQLYQSHWPQMQYVSAPPPVQYVSPPPIQYVSPPQMQYVAPSQQQQPSQLTGLGKIRKFADSNGNLTMYFTWNTFLICFQFQFQNLHIEKRLNFREPPTNCRTMQWIIQNCSAQTPRKSKKP